MNPSVSHLHAVANPNMYAGYTLTWQALISVGVLALASASTGADSRALAPDAPVKAVYQEMQEATKELSRIWNSGMDRASTEYQTAIRQQHEKVIWAADQILSFAPEHLGYQQANRELADAVKNHPEHARPYFIPRRPADLREAAYQAKIHSLQQLGFLPDAAGARARRQIQEFTAWMLKGTRDPILQAEYQLISLRARATSSLPREPGARSREAQALLAEIRTWLEKYPEASRSTRDLLSEAARLAERSRFPDDGVFFYEQLARTATDPAESRFAEGAVRRLKLPGQRLELSGPLLTGGTLDLRDLRGKVVLIDFWYTSCPPCVADIENVYLPLYEKYHRHGFEIVGIPNDSRRRLEPFLEHRQIRWPQIYIAQKPADPQLRVPPDPHPIAARYGIYAWPTLFLVDQDGIVVSTSLHGSEIESALTELLARNPTPGVSAP
jgi:thiol-disulfide isomerase/thioredoxin